MKHSEIFKRYLKTKFKENQPISFLRLHLRGKIVEGLNGVEIGRKER
jgi:hypothetical protein